jgi:antitoxin (DNA-binding transcriptional repressor) of toxin-antitoxin stability system
MTKVNITKFRQNLPSYLTRVAAGEQFQITVKGKVVARLGPDLDEAELARKRLADYRGQSIVGDIVSALPSDWTGDLGNL